MNSLMRINRSRLLVFAVLAFVFLLLFYCNQLTPLQGDDYCYLYNCKDESRIENVWDVFESMYYHRFTTNGRVIPHFFVQTFLTLPKTVFNLVNAAMFTLMLWLCYRFAFIAEKKQEKNAEHNLLLLCCIFGLLWVVSPDFGTVYLWLDGSCNYLWCCVVMALWLFVMARDFLHDTHMKLWQELLFALFCLAVGNYAENSSVSAVFMFMLFIGLSRFYLKRPIKRWHITGFIAMLIGFFLLALAPAELVTKISKPDFKIYFEFFLIYIRYYLNFWPLLLFYVFAYALSYRSGGSRDLRILSLVLIGGSLAAQFVLIFAIYPSERSTVLSMLPLLMACSLLFLQTFEGKARPFICLAAAVLFCFTAYWGYMGIMDMRFVRYRWDYNDSLLQAAAANGETHASIPYIIPDTEYSVFYLWGYIRENPEHYFNVELAKYHGLEEVRGFWHYDTE